MPEEAEPKIENLEDEIDETHQIIKDALVVICGPELKISGFQLLDNALKKMINNVAEKTFDKTYNKTAVINKAVEEKSNRDDNATEQAIDNFANEQPNVDIDQTTLSGQQDGGNKNYEEEEYEDVGGGEENGEEEESESEDGEKGGGAKKLKNTADQMDKEGQKRKDQSKNKQPQQNKPEQDEKVDSENEDGEETENGGAKGLKNTVNQADEEGQKRKDQSNNKQQSPTDGQPAGEQQPEQAQENLQDRENQGYKAYKAKEKGGLTQGINSLRNRGEIKKIDEQIKGLKKQRNPLNNSKRKLQVVLLPLEVSEKSLSAGMRTLQIIKIAIYIIAILSALTIVLFFLGVSGAIWSGGLSINLLIIPIKTTKNALKKNIKRIKKDITKINGQLSKIDKDIQNLERKKRNIINRSLFENNQKQREGEQTADKSYEG